MEFKFIAKMLAKGVKEGRISSNQADQFHATLLELAISMGVEGSSTSDIVLSNNSAVVDNAATILSIEMDKHSH